VIGCSDIHDIHFGISDDLPPIRGVPFKAYALGGRSRA